MKRIEITPTRLQISAEDLKENYSQICVWPGTVLEDENVKDLEDWMLAEFNTRVLVMFTEITVPTSGGPGGRNDIFFRVHRDDVMRFAIPRLRMGIRWWEDVTSGHNYDGCYPDDLLKQFPSTWDAELPDLEENYNRAADDGPYGYIE